jgi:hypothetical protein
MCFNSAMYNLKRTEIKQKFCSNGSVTPPFFPSKHAPMDDLGSEILIGPDVEARNLLQQTNVTAQGSPAISELQCPFFMHSVWIYIAHLSYPRGVHRHAAPHRSQLVYESASGPKPTPNDILGMKDDNSGKKWCSSPWTSEGLVTRVECQCQALSPPDVEELCEALRIGSPIRRVEHDRNANRRRKADPLLCREAEALKRSIYKNKHRSRLKFMPGSGALERLTLHNSVTATPAEGKNFLP